MITPERLKAKILKGVEEGVFPGCTYLLIENDKVIKDYAGFKRLVPKKEPLENIDGLYDLASVTKVIGTTSAVLKLLEKGLVRLDDKISDLLPSFKNGEALRLIHLLTHTSGLRPFILCSEYKSKDELIKILYEEKPKTLPGEKLIYSDLNFILLGDIVEVITGFSLDEFLKSEVFRPLEMFDTTFNPKDALRCVPTEVVNGKAVQGVVHDERARDLGGIAGHAGLFSTVSDLEKFIKMILNDGKFNNKQIFSKRIIDMLFVPQASEKEGILLREEARSLGWILKGSHPCSGDFVSSETIMHTGFTGTHIFIDRKNKIAFVMLTNRVHPTRNNNKHIAFRARLGNLILNS